MSITAKLAVAETALQAIATGGIAGEPNNARDTLAIARDIAKEALCGIDPRYVEWFKERDIRVDALKDAMLPPPVLRRPARRSGQTLGRHAQGNAEDSGRGMTMTNATDMMMRPDLRRRRAESLAHAILQKLAGFLHRDARLGDVHDALLSLLMEKGVEVLTDHDREQMGIPPRGSDGWTTAEVIALEQTRIDAIMKPAGPMVILSTPSSGEDGYFREFFERGKKPDEGKCEACDGTGRHRGIFGGRDHPLCGRCDGTGRQP